MESSASFVRSTFSRNNIETGNLISPVIDFRRPVKHIAEDIFETLKEKPEVKKKGGAFPTDMFFHKIEQG